MADAHKKQGVEEDEGPPHCVRYRVKIYVNFIVANFERVHNNADEHDFTLFAFWVRRPLIRITNCYSSPGTTTTGAQNMGSVVAIQFSLRVRVDNEELSVLRAVTLSSHIFTFKFRELHCTDMNWKCTTGPSTTRVGLVCNRVTPCLVPIYTISPMGGNRVSKKCISDRKGSHGVS